MNYQIGDQVIHWTFGLGTIKGLDEKRLEGQTRLYYVLEAGVTTIWVQADEMGENSLRLPTTRAGFKELLSLLHGPGQELPNHPYQRQTELIQRMQKRTLDELCCIIRDLTSRANLQRLNHHDNSILRRAEAFLLDEWELSLGTPRAEAQRELNIILSEDPETKKALPISAI